jgi:hypothetical protein
MSGSPAGDSLLRGGAATRLRVRGILAVTAQLVRDAADPRKRDVMHGMLDERRRILAELARDLHEDGPTRCLDALMAAVEESDRTFGQLLDGVTTTS